MEMHEYRPGELIPVTSSLYRVIYDSPREGEYMQIFYAGETFPPSPKSGTEVRYRLPVGVLKREINRRKRNSD
jgi:hypothetical protein